MAPAGKGPKATYPLTISPKGPSKQVSNTISHLPPYLNHSTLKSQQTFIPKG